MSQTTVDPAHGVDPVETYGRLTPNSRRAKRRARALLPNGLSRHTLDYSPYPFFAHKGEAAYLEDIDGRRYLDFVNNYTSLIHGHAHPPTVAAVQHSVAQGTAPGAPTEAELTLARELSRRFPSLEWIRFATSGSEAVGLALRAAKAHTGRSCILKLEGGFHGCFEEVQVSIHSDPLTEGSWSYGQPSGLGLSPVQTLVAVYNDVESLRAVFAECGEHIAALIMEPFLGNAALVSATVDFVQQAVRLAYEHGALLIFDEIQSCRLAYGGAQSVYGVKPDITTLGKTIGGGLPLAAVGGKTALKPLFSGPTPSIVQTGTFNAFPPALVAGTTTLHHWQEADIGRLNRMGERTRLSIQAIFAQHGVPVVVNGEGSLFHISFSDVPVQSYAAHVGSRRSLWDALHRELLVGGVYISSRGTGSLSTPMTEGDLDRFLSSLDHAVGRLKKASLL